MKTKTIELLKNDLQEINWKMYNIEKDIKENKVKQEDVLPEWLMLRETRIELKEEIYKLKTAKS